MIQFEKAILKDVDSIVKVSEQAFLDNNLCLPESYTNYDKVFQTLNSGFLFKILFNGSLIGSFLVFRIGFHNYQLDSLIIAKEYQKIGIGKKSVNFLLKRFPEATVWFVDINNAWQSHTDFLARCGFFESTFDSKKKTRYIKLVK